MNPSTPAATGLASVLIAVGLATMPCVRAQEHPLVLDHDSRFATALRSLSEHDLKAFYLRCSHAASQGSLGSSDVAPCSVGYETLLNDVFGGDFLALLAWSRSQSVEATRSAFDRARLVEPE